MMHWEWCYIGEHELPEKELISWGYQCFGHSIVAFTFCRDAWTLASVTSNPRYSTLDFRNSHLWILPYILASLSLFSVVSSDLSVAPKNYRKLISIFDCLMDQCTIIKTYSLAPILFVRKEVMHIRTLSWAHEPLSKKVRYSLSYSSCSSERNQKAVQYARLLPRSISIECESQMQMLTVFLFLLGPLNSPLDSIYPYSQTRTSNRSSSHRPVRHFQWYYLWSDPEFMSISHVFLHCVSLTLSLQTYPFNIRI